MVRYGIYTSIKGLRAIRIWLARLRLHGGIKSRSLGLTPVSPKYEEQKKCRSCMMRCMTARFGNFGIMFSALLKLWRIGRRVSHWVIRISACEVVVTRWYEESGGGV